MGGSGSSELGCAAQYDPDSDARSPQAPHPPLRIPPAGSTPSQAPAGPPAARPRSDKVGAATARALRPQSASGSTGPGTRRKPYDSDGLRLPDDCPRAAPGRSASSQVSCLEPWLVSLAALAREQHSSQAARPSVKARPFRRSCGGGGESPSWRLHRLHHRRLAIAVPDGFYFRVSCNQEKVRNSRALY